VARGIVAVGQFAIGVIAIAQFGVGLLFGFGQIILSPVAVAQIAIGILFGLGQLACGVVAIGQVAVAYYALCQAGSARHLWSPWRQDGEAVRFFRQLARMAGLSWGK
jgi:hypothetical protein